LWLCRSLTETWLGAGSSVIGRLRASGYSVIDVPRPRIRDDVSQPWRCCHFGCTGLLAVTVFRRTNTCYIRGRRRLCNHKPALERGRYHRQIWVSTSYHSVLRRRGCITRAAGCSEPSMSVLTGRMIVTLSSCDPSSTPSVCASVLPVLLTVSTASSTLWCFVPLFPCRPTTLTVLTIGYFIDW
jgi:hypothetical protein